MKRIAQYIIWCGVVMTTLSFTVLESLAYDGEDTGISDFRSFGELSSQLAEWASQSSHYSLNMLGITEMECNCTFISGEDERLWLFQTEPEIWEVDRTGPSHGKLKKGDVIVAIDGMLITTRKAGIRFANLIAGEPVELEIRRGKHTRTTTVVPRAVAKPDVPIELTVRRSDHDVTIEPGATSFPELARSIEELSKRAAKIGEMVGSLGVPAPPGPYSLPEFNIDFAESAPRGWVGFGLLFRGSIRQNDAGKPAEWEFNEPPTIRSIQPGSPADEAGLQVDDVLLEIDGKRLDSNKGGDRFSRMEPGQVIEWKVERGGETFSVETTAAERPERKKHEAELESFDLDTRQPIRYSGTLGETEIEVRASQKVRVDVDEETGEIVIRTGDSTVRLKSKDER